MPYRATYEYTLLNAEVITANGSSSVIAAVSKFIEGVLYLVVSNKGGTDPTLDFVVETARASSATFHQHTTVTQITDNGNQAAVKLTNLGNHLRISWTIGGTDNPTYTVSAYLVVKN